MTTLEIILAVVLIVLALSYIRSLRLHGQKIADLHLHLSANESRIESLQNSVAHYTTAVEHLKGSVVRHQKDLEVCQSRYDKAKRLVYRLRKQQVTYKRAMTWVETPEQDLRVLQSQVREQLSLDLQASNDIKFKTEVNYVERYQANEITVTGIITVNQKS